MKCSVCGAELGGNEMVCGSCGAPVGDGRQGGEGDREVTEQFARPLPGVEDVPDNLSFAAPPISEPEKPKKKTGLIIGIVAAAAVVTALAGVFAFTRLFAKDPKEVVIAAFENIYTEEQRNPMEELFGLSQFRDKAMTSDVEVAYTIILDDCSEAEIKEFAGSGLRVVGKSDRTNKAGFANIGVIYKDMDLANLDMYYGDSTLMVAVPELSTRVFTLDLSEGLAERIKNSPVLGFIIQESGVDIDEISDYLDEIVDQAESGEMASFDFDALMTRYREGSKAKEKFKEALSVEKGEKGIFTVDGKEQKCRGYQVVVSKDSMVDFLKDTTDFFLNDQELQDQYLYQLEQAVKMIEILNGDYYYGMTAQDIFSDSMEDMEQAVAEMIDFLDETLSDVEMTVYVDKKGRLAAVDGTTVLETGDEEIEGEFAFRFLGGTYLTENMTADISLADDGQQIEIAMERQGSYDGKELTGDMDIDVKMRGREKMDAGISLTGTYDCDGGDYHMGLTVTADKSKVADLSVTGVVDELVKGETIRLDIDELEVSLMDGMGDISFRGEFACEPLGEAVTALEGDAFDVVAADESDWQSVIMEIYMGAMGLMTQIDF
ncbi:MAG: zinc ribbon domain-containing protein [Hungatella sp.]|nr:zinc ribbon domain-containing protein [Hungatella sp.]